MLQPQVALLFVHHALFLQLGHPFRLTLLHHGLNFALNFLQLFIGQRGILFRQRVLQTLVHSFDGEVGWFETLLNERVADGESEEVAELIIDLGRRIILGVAGGGHDERGQTEGGN